MGSEFCIGKEIGLLHGEIESVKKAIKQNNSFLVEELANIKNRLKELEEAKK